MRFRRTLCRIALATLTISAFAATTDTQQVETTDESEVIIEDVRIKGFIPDRVGVAEPAPKEATDKAPAPQQASPQQAAPETDTSIPALKDTPPEIETKPTAAPPAAAEAPKAKAKPSTAREDRLLKKPPPVAKTDKKADAKAEEQADAKKSQETQKKTVSAKKPEPKKIEARKTESKKTETASAENESEDRQSNEAATRETAKAKKSEVVDLDSKPETPISANPAAGKKRGSGVVVSSASERTTGKSSGKLIADRPVGLAGRPISPPSAERYAPINIHKKELTQRQSTGTYTDAEGEVTGIRQQADGSLRMVLRTDDGDSLQVVVDPTYGVRVPQEGSHVRVHGRRMSSAGERLVIRASEIDRTTPARREVTRRAETTRYDERDHYGEPPHHDPMYPEPSQRIMAEPPHIPPPMFMPPPPPPGFFPGPPMW